MLISFKAGQNFSKDLMWIDCSEGSWQGGGWRQPLKPPPVTQRRAVCSELQLPRQAGRSCACAAMGAEVLRVEPGVTTATP